VTIAGAVANAGLVEAVKSDLTVNGAVTGTGSAVINAGALAFGSSFSEAVTFSSSTGELILAQSQTYTGAITGFAKSTGTVLDLRDIGFVSASEATFSGTKNGGVLTVTDGTHTAKITLVGNYTTSAFVAASDGDGGVTVVDPPAGKPSPAAFAGVMAGLASSVAAPVHTIAPTLGSTPTLTRPHVAIA
jgi:hypothetical protein